MKQAGSADPAGSVAAIQQVIKRQTYQISTDGVYLLGSNVRTHRTMQKTHKTKDCL